jgi:hypothetical protein
MSIKYIVELTARTDYPPERALAAADFDRNFNIYVFSVKKPTTPNYWTNWGGKYTRLPKTSNLEVFFGQFLQRVTSASALELTSNSYYVVGDNIYINIPKKPWQYFSELTEVGELQFYSTSVRDESKPWDNNYEGIPYPVKMFIPRLNSTLSDVISGAVKPSTFSIDLENSDGFFDDIDETNYFNTPITIKRSDKEIPDLADFKIIRRGLVDYVTADASKFKITGADFFRTYTEEVTKKFTVSDFPNIPTENIDKSIPVGWGALKGLELFEVDTNDYIALDQDFITSVQAVYDSDGNSISFTFSGGIITATGAATADVTGKTNNKIGQIITEEIDRVGNTPYIEGPWDKTETDIYVGSSAPIALYFPSGNLRSLIESCLKNDSAFFMTKNDGRLTIRQWGQAYDSHNLNSWQIMKIPTKSTQESKKFFNSSVSVLYGFNDGLNKHELEKKDTSRELEVVERYRKSKFQNFPTRLINESDAINLATLLLNRFGTISELIFIPMGASTVDINKLDEVVLDVNINGRQISTKTTWIVREVDPAQDVLFLESV